MKKYYNGTLFTLLSFLFCFNLYGQIRTASPESLVCLNADVDLIIEDVIWDANVSDLIEFYEKNGTNVPRSFYSSPATLNEVPLPRSFHIVTLGCTDPYTPMVPPYYNEDGEIEFSSEGESIYTFDISVAPTAKPVIFATGICATYPSLIIDENGYVEGMRIRDVRGGTGVASTAAAMGRQGGVNGNKDICIEITTTNRTGNLNGNICDLDDASYIFCKSFFTINREAQHVSTLQSLNIYPNPTQNNLFVETNGLDIQKIELLTLLGQVQNQVPIRYGIDKLQINTRNLLSGVYLLKLETVTETIVEKIIIH